VKFLSLALGFILIGCTVSSPPPHCVRLNLFNEPSSLDPRKGSDFSTHTVALMLGEGLTRIAPSGEPELALADSVFREGLNFTFHIRAATWSDGMPITAHDFERSWKEALAPDFPADQAYLLYSIRGARAAKEGRSPIEDIRVRALDTQTLRVELELPCPHFLEQLAHPTFFPNRDDAFCGPFLLKEWRPGDLICVEQNPLFWDAEHVHIGRIEMVSISDEHTELMLFEQGLLDWAGSPCSTIPFDLIPQWRERPEFRQVPIRGTYVYRLNTHHPLLANKKIRRALAFAIDREYWVEHLCKNVHFAATSFLPDSEGEIGFNPEQAQELFAEGLAELGLETPPPLALSFNANEDHLQVAQTVQQYWQQLLGLPVDLRPQDWQVHLSALAHGSYEVGRHALIARYADPLDLLCLEWEDAPFQRAMEAAQSEVDNQTRNKYLRQAEMRLIDEMPMIPLYHLRYSSLCNPQLKNVFMSDLGQLDLRWAYFETPPVN